MGRVGGILSVTVMWTRGMSAQDAGRHGEHAKDGECTEQSQEKCREPLTLDERLVRQLRACMHYFHYGMGRKSGQQRILSLLRERRGMTQRELQDVLGVQPGSLSEILNKVEAGGYIRRRQNERDGGGSTWN